MTTSEDGGPLDVVAVGSPLVDVVATVSDEQLQTAGLLKGGMELVDLARAEAIYDHMGPTVEVSGGSVANTMVGVSTLGGRAGFVGKMADDPLGQSFVHSITAAGVECHPVVVPGQGNGAPSERSGTGRCLVLVTPEGERSMATHLGVASTIRPADVPEDMVARGQVLYLEGYLWDLPPAQEAMRRAVAVCHEREGSVALSLSDPSCVERHQRAFLDLVRDDIDVLFGNEEELVKLFGVPSFDAAVEAAEETGLLVAATRGPKGSVVTAAGGPVAVPAMPVVEVADTTGAGDLYAAGFLYGLTHGADPVRCAELGGLCAAEVISHLGARPQHDLRALATSSGLL